MSFGMFPVAGKRGKRRSSQLMERTANKSASRSASRSDRFPAVMFRRLPKPSFLVFKHMNGTTGAATAFIPGDDEHSAFLECEAITSFSKRSDQSLDDRAVRNQEGITGKRAGALD